VIGVPIASSSLNGMDSLLATVMMPPGIPVGTVAIGGAENAGLLAAQILSSGDPELARKLEAERDARRRKVLESDGALRAELGGGGDRG
jgi:5-(carboxyamino)imidazole ribonucleotide mutase